MLYDKKIILKNYYKTNAIINEMREKAKKSLGEYMDLCFGQKMYHDRIVPSWIFEDFNSPR